LKRSESEDCRAEAWRRRATGHTLDTDASSFDLASQPKLKYSVARTKAAAPNSENFRGKAGFHSPRAATRQAGFPALFSPTSLAVNAIGFMFYQK